MINLPIKVICVDDDDLVAEAISLKLRRCGDVRLIGRLQSADDLLQAAWHDRPEVVLLDIHMPGRCPFEVLHDLAELFPNVRVVMLSADVKRELIDRAIENGAWGYVSKHAGADVIVDAIHRVARGELALGPDVQQVYRGT